MYNNINISTVQGKGNAQGMASLENVLSREIKIPSFQRPYAWTSDNIKDLFDTIKKNFLEKRPTFLGSIIFCDSEDSERGREKYLIIDGQQRLTSLLVVLKRLNKHIQLLITKLKKKTKKSEKEREYLYKLRDLSKLIGENISSTSITRESDSADKKEKDILKYINSLSEEEPDKGDVKDISKSVDTEILEFISQVAGELNDDKKNDDQKKILDAKPCLEASDYILDQIIFCNICIKGEGALDFAIDMFITMNSTGEPLTAFEIFQAIVDKKDVEPKAEYRKIKNLAEKVNKNLKYKRADIIKHNGKLMLFLPLYRVEWCDGPPPTKFKAQYDYIKKILEKGNNLKSICSDVDKINNFIFDYWKDKKVERDVEKFCLNFLCALNHERVIPVLLQFYSKNIEDIEEKKTTGKALVQCTAFSVLWRAFYNGKTNQIDKAYLEVTKILIENRKADLKTKIEKLNIELKKQFCKKINPDKSKKKEKIFGTKEAKERWVNQLKTIDIYEAKNVAKFLLLVIYDKMTYSKGKVQILRDSRRILNPDHWQGKNAGEKYKTIEHLIPQSRSKDLNYIHALGNLALIPARTNSALGKKLFKDKKTQIKKAVKDPDNKDYLPFLEELLKYDKFEQSEVDKRTKELGTIAWDILTGKDWLDWK